MTWLTVSESLIRARATPEISRRKRKARNLPNLPLYPTLRLDQLFEQTRRKIATGCRAQTGMQARVGGSGGRAEEERWMAHGTELVSFDQIADRKNRGQTTILAMPCQSVPRGAEFRMPGSVAFPLRWSSGNTKGNSPAAPAARGHDESHSATAVPTKARPRNKVA